MFHEFSPVFWLLLVECAVQSFLCLGITGLCYSLPTVSEYWVFLFVCFMNVVQFSSRLDGGMGGPVFSS